jgi:branched-chain amino acid transport system ATP-binding protein
MTDIIAIDALRAGYGGASVLFDVSLALPQGQSLALLGRNGMGKTTLLTSIIGLTRHTGGRIRLDQRDITRLRPEQRALAGIGWVPQERNIFRSLTVEENLTCVARPGPWDITRIYTLFPRLQERRRNMGHQLSGGEQQMLAIARALVLNPRLLLLDEPTEGLAPIIVGELLAVLHRLTRKEGLSSIIVEQHARKVLNVTDRAVILERGRVVHDGASAALLGDHATLDRYLGATG